MSKRNKSKITELSVFVAFALRHDPGAVGLTLDENGWADADALVRCAQNAGKPIDRALLDTIVAVDEKRRYEFSDDRPRVRAVQGHTIPVDLELEPQTPPDVLYHGTATRFLDGIRRDGIVKKRRNYVHLSVDSQTAVGVGARHGEPAVLEIDAKGMCASGLKFYMAKNGVWLTDKVPVEFIKFD